jgi:hypothetical protein
MPVIQVAPGPSGGGGDATAANQSLQIQQISANGSGSASAFKDGNFVSVFQEDNSGNSLFYKSIQNQPSGVGLRTNVIACISFTNTTAAQVAADLTTYLSTNACFVISVTSSQGGGSHDLFLTYSI